MPFAPKDKKPQGDKADAPQSKQQPMQEVPAEQKAVSGVEELPELEAPLKREVPPKRAAPKKEVSPKRAAPTRKQAPPKTEKPTKREAPAEKEPQAKGEKPLKPERKRRRVKGPNATVDKLALAAGRTGHGHTIGQALYLLGFYAECKFVQIYRILKLAVGLLGQFFGWMLGGLFRGAWRFIKSVAQDLVSPLGRLSSSARNIRNTVSEERSRAVSVETGGSKAGAYFQLAINIAKILAMPLAAVVFVFTVSSTLAVEFNLAVIVNDTVVGYVPDEATFESARNMVRDRIVAAEGLGREDWQVQPEFRIAGMSSLSTKEQLANSIMTSFATDEKNALTPAMGLYVNDNLRFVTTEPEALDRFLESMKEQYDPHDGVTEVGFAQKVEYNVEGDDLYFAASVTPLDEITETLTQVVAEERTHVADGEETLSEIAHNANITLSELEAYNPEYRELAAAKDKDDDDEEEEEQLGEVDASIDPEYVPQENTVLVTKPEQRYLQVATYRLESSVRPIRFEEVFEETDTLPKGYTNVMEPGIEGSERVWYVVTSLDGVETRLPAEDIPTEILSYPTRQLTHVGTKDISGIYEGSTGDGVAAYIWPVPDYTAQTRGYLGGGHRGLDITAPAWTNIYACQSGVVVEAGWHYSWGWQVVIDHGNGMTTRYAHCIELNVAAGDSVSQGQVIGFVGSTGDSTGNHLHLEFLLNGVYDDPANYVQRP